VPAGTKIHAAQLKLYFDQSSETNTNTVQSEAHQATSAWTEWTVNWNSPVNTTLGSLGYNMSYIDDSYTGSTSMVGALARRLGGGG
jgi:hypothetical protein